MPLAIEFEDGPISGRVGTTIGRALDLDIRRTLGVGPAEAEKAETVRAARLLQLGVIDLCVGIPPKISAAQNTNHDDAFLSLPLLPSLRHRSRDDNLTSKADRVGSAGDDDERSMGSVVDVVY